MDNVLFYPIVVSRGRKFKGHGYSIGIGPCSSSWAYSISNAKIWDPISKKIAYANEDFVEEDTSVTPEKLEADKEEYIKCLVEDTVKYCTSHSSDPDSSATKQWIRNSLMKKLPKDLVDSLYPDQRDVATEVEKTIRWANTLESRPMMVYGKMCKGGKSYSPTRKAKIAYRHLKKIGMADKPDFEAAWSMWTTLLGLPDVRAAVDEEDKQRKQDAYDSYYGNDYA